MTNKQTLLALAERCEAATCADYALDLEIAEYGYQNRSLFGVNYDPQLWMERNCWAPTVSLDDAMKLVPDGAGLNIRRYWIASSDAPVWSAEISTGGIPSDPRRVFDCYDAANPALAVAAASLRARAGDGG